MELTLDWLRRAFQAEGYVCGDELLVPVYLALALQKPLLVEGAPGVGKTELAKTLARCLDTRLIRLQCYEGLDENKAFYEWNYQRQLIRIQLAGAQGGAVVEEDVFSPDYLLERPLLQAIRAGERVVLLIDEVDRTDEEFEAFLFEVLSDFQVSIPELGTVRAQAIPVVVLTSNRARDLSDALKRRCVYLFIDYPSVQRELSIVRTRLPGAGEQLARQVALAVSHIRSHPEVQKKPSIAETLDWAAALVRLGRGELDPDAIDRTLNLVLKSHDDLRLFRVEPQRNALSAAARGEGLTRP
ncbi:MAG: MoxR family ATPase [Bacillota bacterium]